MLLALVLAPSAQAGSPAAVPSAGAGRCDITQLPTLTPRFGSPPRTLVPGRAVSLRVEVVRATGGGGQVPAEGAQVLVGLTGADWGTYDAVVTDSAGRATLRLVVPRHARGPAEIDVEAFRVVVDLPCLSVEENGRVVTRWGRAG